MSAKQDIRQHSQTSCCIACICNGELRGFDRAKSLAARNELLIAADGGQVALIPKVSNACPAGVTQGVESNA